MKNHKTNPHAMNATRTLRDYLKHETRLHGETAARENTLCFCVGFLTQTGLTPEQMADTIAALNMDLETEANRHAPDWIARLRQWWDSLLLRLWKPATSETKRV